MRSPENLEKSLLELIRVTATKLPPDAREALEAARKTMPGRTLGRYALDSIQENLGLARDNAAPICQDTGYITFYVSLPVGLSQRNFVEAAHAAVSESTKRGLLRQNSVNALTGKNEPGNIGIGHPAFHFTESDGPFEVRVLLKGGGCENVGAQYSLPHAPTGAGRDLNGVRKVILDAVFRAQGQGCSPGFLGVAIGADRAAGMAEAKKQLLQRFDRRNPDPLLARLEEDIIASANELEIGPMGFGGANTLLGCRIGAFHRHPASFFVSIAYMCWAFRRQGITLAEDWTIAAWWYRP